VLVLTATNSRPTGVSLIVILCLIYGVAELLVAVIFIVVARVSISWLGIIFGVGVRRLVFLVLSGISIGFLFYGVTWFFLAYGLWNGHGWAWTWALSSSVVGLFASIIAFGFGIGIVGLASNAISIYYLTRTDVKVFFGKVALTKLTSIPSSSPSSIVERFCVHCGGRLSGNEVYCPSCGSKV
jgi:hypothetical protein